jgi:hypothetical protein
VGRVAEHRRPYARLDDFPTPVYEHPQRTEIILL